jgi:iron complex outermembrane receptor protein
MLLLLACQGVIAQSVSLKDTVDLHQVNVWAQRKIEHTGVTRTKIDSIVLRESISNTLAQVLSQNTTVFIKSYGRGSLATASFRGTAASHTQVTWNGMKINSPMLGMVDFSLIPSFFIDDMTLLHGAGSVDAGEGALGGAIVLKNKHIETNNKLHIVQGFGSYNSYDSYLRYNYGKDNLKFTTRLYNTYSKNDFKFTNTDKFDVNDLNKDPEERNRNAQFRNTHLLQEVYYKKNNHHHFSFTTWAYQSTRSIPMLTTDYSDDKESTNEQRDKSLRSVLSWRWLEENFNMTSRLGYSYKELDFLVEKLGGEQLNTTIDAKSKVNNIYSEIEANYDITKDFKLSAKVNYNLFKVDSHERMTLTGYKKDRHEVSPYLALRYKAFGIWGLSYNVRKTINNDVSSPFIHAFLTDVLLWNEYNLILRSSVVKNHHAPTLNDLYFQPGGNINLQTERGITYDIGIEFQRGTREQMIKGSATYYHSNIDNWIVWLPSRWGYWEARNIKNVYSKGLELKTSLNKTLGKVHLFVDANWSQTISINNGDSKIYGDESVGKQLVYIPKYSSSLMCKLSFRNYFVSYKYNHYSERFTSSSNDLISRDRLPAYIMNEVSFGSTHNTQYGRFDLSFIIHNLFNEKYKSVLKRAMPGINFNLLISYKL